MQHYLSFDRKVGMFAIVLMGALVFGIIVVEQAAAHKFIVSAWVEEDTVYVESGFSDVFRLLQYIGLPITVPSRQSEGFPNGEKMRSIHVPTLLIHAAEDHLIPLHEAEELLRLCAAEEKRLLVIPRADHNSLMMIGRDQYFEALDEFIKKHA